MPLPKPFEDEKEFLEYFESHSRTPRAAFTIEQVNYIYELAREGPLFDFSSAYVFMSLRYNNPETRKLLRKARKNISEKTRREYGDNVTHLDDYRKAKNNIRHLDDCI